MYGCGSQKSETESKQTTISANTESITKIPEENTVVGIGHRNKTPERDYMIYIMNNGEVESTVTVTKQIEDNINLNCIYSELLYELMDTIGYSVEIKNIEVTYEKVSIEFGDDSDFFYPERYNVALVNPVKYSGYDSMAWGILDSIRETIRQNLNEEVEIRYTKAGEVLQLPKLKVEVTFPDEEAYQGSQYYIQKFLSRGEGNLADDIELDMKYNEVIAQLNEDGIVTSQTQRFSMLGNHQGWEDCDSVDEYLRSAWIHMELSASQYCYIFDGEDSQLVEIKVHSRNVPSSRGLCVGDSLTKLYELYGTQYTTYQMDGGIVYEFNLEDCFFHVETDAAEEYVVQYGIAHYSYEDEMEGKRILEHIQAIETMKQQGTTEGGL